MEHQCDKMKEKGRVFKSYYDHGKEKKVFYCHYCGENVSVEEYIEWLERKAKTLEESLDMYQSILNGGIMDGTAIMMQEQAKEAVSYFKRIRAERDKYRDALKKISVPMPGSRDNELVLYYERIAQSALKEE